MTQVAIDTSEKIYGGTTGDSASGTTQDIEKVLAQYSHLVFWGCFTTREYWAQHVKMARTTIYRWESLIIKASPKIARLYYDGAKRIGKEKLDDYQRFILCYIYSLKHGYIVPGHNLTNEEVISYLEGKDESGRPRCFSLTRTKVEQYVSEHY